MDWLAEMEDEEDERRLLKRVVAAFYLLACIAGLSCIMPLRARSYVLSRLRRIEVSAIEIVSNRARDRGLTLQHHDHQIGDALLGGDSRAEAMRFACSFRLLAMLLNHLIEHYPRRRMNGMGGNTAPFAFGGNLLTTLCRSLAETTRRQLRQAPMRLAFEPIDSS